MTGSKLTKKDYTKTTLRAYFLQNGFNYSNYQGLGYALVMYPAFKKLYGDNPAKLAEELDNNCEFYNTNPNFLPFITSIHLAMAENGMEYDEIRGIKMALMGPLAGLFICFYGYGWCGNCSIIVLNLRKRYIIGNQTCYGWIWTSSRNKHD